MVETFSSAVSNAALACEVIMNDNAKKSSILLLNTLLKDKKLAIGNCFNILVMFR